jgi:ketosteroid isomerase-like protein
MIIGDEQRVRDLYVSFNARDIDAVLGTMAADVDWPNAWEGRRISGHDAVRDYWERQWQEINPRVEPESIVTGSDGRIAVDVHQVVRDRSATVIADGRVVHVYELRDGLIVRMTVEEAG